MLAWLFRPGCPKGVFLLRRAGTGTWTVRAYHPSGLPGTGTATLIEEGGSTPCHLALRPGAWIEVEVHAPGSGPFAVRSGISVPNPSSASPNDGRFQDRSLPETERRALRSGRRVRSGDRIRLGPFESGKVGLWARATLPVPGSDATVEVYRNATVEMNEGATTRVTIRFEPDAGR